MGQGLLCWQSRGLLLVEVAFAVPFLASAFSDTCSAQQCCHLVLEKSQGAAGLDGGGHGEQGEAFDGRRLRATPFLTGWF